MTFSSGQLYFAIVFLIGFLIAMFFAFRKDNKVNQKHYKGIYQVFILIAVVIIFYIILVRVLKILS